MGQWGKRDGLPQIIATVREFALVKVGGCLTMKGDGMGDRLQGLPQPITKAG
jgi:hypothetical protein